MGRPIHLTVELFPAHVWTCPCCGRRNYADCCPVEMTPDERAEMLADGFDPDSGEWVTAPPTVECPCGQVFETADCRGGR